VTSAVCVEPSTYSTQFSSNRLLFHQKSLLSSLPIRGIIAITPSTKLTHLKTALFPSVEFVNF
jgi:hypothetical protein